MIFQNINIAFRFAIIFLLGGIFSGNIQDSTKAEYPHSMGV